MCGNGNGQGVAVVREAPATVRVVRPKAPEPVDLAEYLRVTRRRMVVAGLDCRQVDWYGLVHEILLGEIRRGW